MVKCVRALFIAAIVAVECWLMVSAAVCQSSVENKLSVIDWERASSDALKSASPILNAFKETNSAELSSIKLPVLIGDPTILDSAPRLRGQGTSYVVAYTLPSAKLSILGTSAFISRPEDQSVAQSASGSTRAFDRGDDGTDLSFLRYGASYVLRLSCAEPEDQRCVSDTFLNSIANNLLVVGGKK